MSQIPNNTNLVIDSRDWFDSLIEMLHRLIDESDPRMQMTLSTSHSGDVYLSMPSFLERYLHDALSYKYMTNSFQRAELGKLFVFRGVTIIPSIDLSFTLFHKDYILFNEDWMIRKIPLQPIHTQKEQWFTKYVMTLKQLPVFDNTKDSGLN